VAFIGTFTGRNHFNRDIWSAGDRRSVQIKNAGLFGQESTDIGAKAVVAGKSKFNA
jgi:hypothetical protein